MAITNNQIIAMEMMQLLKGGKITGSEEIHTFSRQKALGYSVKKGQHAITKFAIWKYSNGKTAAGDDSIEENNGYCFMKMSCWFSSSQVEKIEGVHDVKSARPNYKKHTTTKMRVLEDDHHALFCNF